MQAFESLFVKHRHKILPNRWDIISLVIVFGTFIALALLTKEMSTPYQLGKPIPIELKPALLPYYSVRTVMRMAIALIFSLIFSLTFGTWAAKSRHAERIIIPMIDILQSVPILAFQSISIAGFIALFPNSLLGPEAASIFAIFSSQAWNMALSIYQSIKIVPNELKDAASIFHLSSWQRFWRLEIPFAMPSLVWNMMISMSSGWFFVVASEAISVANHNITLPGIGSYILVAIENANLTAVGYAIMSMFVVILLYDQLFFRPLVSWADKFRGDTDEQQSGKQSWFVNLIRRTRLMRGFGKRFSSFREGIINHRMFLKRTSRGITVQSGSWRRAIILLWYGTLIASLSYMTYFLWDYITTHLSMHEIERVTLLGLYTAIRVTILIFLASIIWVPIGVYIGTHPGLAKLAQPIVQFLAAFPANLLFPVVVVLIVRYKLNVEIWTSPLMILSSQWYLVFNIIAGALSLPKHLHQVAKTFRVRGWQRWKRLILPGIYPYYITGAITAAGGAWNASILAEVVSWGKVKLQATGLGAYITNFTEAGDFPRIALGISMMCIYVLLFNRLVWQPLYRHAETKYQVTSII